MHMVSCAHVVVTYLCRVEYLPGDLGEYEDEVVAVGVVVVVVVK